MLVVLAATALLALPRVGLADQTADVEAALAVAGPWWANSSEESARVRELEEALNDARSMRDQAMELLRSQMREAARILDLAGARYGRAPSPPEGDDPDGL